MRAVLIAATAMALGFCGSYPLAAESVSGQSAQAAAPARAPAAKPRTRVTIIARQPAASLYPSPYLYAYPGPGYARQCASRLEPEARPSGTVIVPRMQCWWVRGNS